MEIAYVEHGDDGKFYDGGTAGFQNYAERNPEIMLGLAMGKKQRGRRGDYFIIFPVSGVQINQYSINLKNRAKKILTLQYYNMVYLLLLSISTTFRSISFSIITSVFLFRYQT